MQVGTQEAGDNVAVAPDGTPEAEKETDWGVPELNVAVIVFDVDWPCITVLLPPFESEKSNVGVELLTVTVSGAEVPWFPAVSVATAVSV